MAKKDVPIILSARHYREYKHLSEGSTAQIPFTIHDKIVQVAASPNLVEPIFVYFKRAYISENHIRFGDIGASSYKHLFGDLSLGKRIHILLSSDEWQMVSQWQYCLAAPMSHTMQLLAILGLGSGVENVSQA